MTVSTSSTTSSTAKHNAANHVYIDPIAKMKQEQLVKRFDKEIGWVGLVDQDDYGHLMVSDILVPKQAVTGTEVDWDMDALAELMAENPEDAHRMRYFGHSHVNMSAYFSHVDWGEMINLIEPTKMPFCIFFVENKKRETACLIEIFNLDDVKQPLRVSVEAELVTMLPNGVASWADEMIEKNVEVKKTQVSTYYNQHGYSGITKPSTSKSSTSSTKDVDKSKSGKATTVKALSGQEVTHVVYDEKDIIKTGRCTLLTDTHRITYLDGKESGRMTIDKWEEEHSPKALTELDLKEILEAKAQAKADLFNLEDDKSQIPIVSAHRSVRSGKRKRRQRLLRNELAVLASKLKEPLIVFDEGYQITLMDWDDMDIILRDEYEWDNDESFETAWWSGKGDPDSPWGDKENEEDDVYMAMARAGMLGDQFLV